MTETANCINSQTNQEVSSHYIVNLLPEILFLKEFAN